jgi:hypothetical protein
MHLRVEAGLVSLVGDEVEDFFRRPLDDDLAFHLDHRMSSRPPLLA